MLTVEPSKTIICRLGEQTKPEESVDIAESNINLFISLLRPSMDWVRTTKY